MRSDPGGFLEGTCLRRVFSIDPRSLAIWRMALGVVVLLDVRLRWPVAGSMYSDAGWLTRDLAGTLHRLLAGEVPTRATWSVLWLDGSEMFSRAVLVAMALAAIPFLLGWRTRLFNVVLWILVASVHARNPLVTTSADMLLKLMLMWGMFLPLGRIWSIDARRARAPANVEPVFSLASAGLILQLFQLYLFTGIAKLNGPWLDGTAMEYVLRLDIYTTSFGQWLLGFPWLLRGVAWGTLALELGVVWLVLVPWRASWPKIATLLLFWGFHIGIALTMQIGLFCPICMSVWLVTIPGGFWDWLGWHGANRAGSRAGSALAGSPWMAAVSALLILVTLLWNICQAAEARCPGFIRIPLAVAGRALATDQNFRMFGQLHRENSWFVYRAKLADGSEVDLMRDISPPVWGKPPRVATTLPDHNWRKLHDNLTQERLAAFRQPLLEYVVRDWNRRHEVGRQAVAAELVKLSQPIGPDYNGIDQKSAVWATAGGALKRPGSHFDDMLQRMKDGSGPAF